MKELDECFNVGVVGFSAQEFDKEKAKKLISQAFDQAEEKAKKFGLQINCISGYTDLGIPGLAYREAVSRDWKTTGVACEKAKDYKLFPVDFEFIEGKNWGDESNKFLSMIDLLIKVGGGKQSNEEVAAAKQKKISVVEFEI